MTKLKKYKFSELYEMSSGISSKPEQAGHGAPFVSFSTVFHNYFLPEVLPDKMDTSEKDQEKCSIKKGDLFLTRTSETLDELGMSCVAIKDYPKATFSGFLKRFRPTQNNITYHKFLAFYLRSKLFRKTMSNNAIMTLRASFNEQIFSYLDLLLPEYTEQVKAGDLLYLFNDKIELNNKINAELEAMAKLIYDYWFVQFDFPDANGKPYKSSGGKMVYNEELKREVPDGWEVKLIGNCFDYLEGPGIRKFNYSDDGHNFINIRCIKGGDLDVSNATKIKKELIENLTHFLLEEEDVVVSTSGSLGRSAVVRKEHLPLLLNTSVIRFRPIKSNYHSFMVIYLKSQYFLGKLTQLATGSIQKNFGPTHLNEIKDCIPPDATFTEFQKVASPILSKQLINKSENQKLAELRDWLLPMLMNGQVTVGEVESELGMVADEGEAYGK